MIMVQIETSLPWNPPSEAWCEEKSHILNINVTAPNTYHSTKNPKSFDITDLPKKTLHIETDGNCFYRTIAAIVTGNSNCNSEDYVQVKNALFRFMDTNSEFMEDVTGKKNYAATSKSRLHNAWATLSEIIAMAAFLNTNIAVHSKYNNILKWSVITPSHRINSHPSEEDFIYIKHVNENHYEPVLSI